MTITSLLRRPTRRVPRPLDGDRHGDRRRRGRVVRLLPLSVLAASIALPSGAGAHGGIDVAEGGGGGTRILVQGSVAGPGEVDLATTLDGPGSGKGSKVVYWVRPAGRTRSVRIATDRDEGGTHHAEIPTAGRGSWQDWDVAAYVTLSTGRRLRVTNDRRDPPGPPARPARPRPVTTTTSRVPVPEPDVEVPADQEALEDVSGQGDGVPGWVIPSVVVLALAAVAVIVIRNRRLPDDEATDEPEDPGA